MASAFFRGSMSVIECQALGSTNAKAVASRPKECLNCETPLDGEFCHVCGQPASTERYSLTTLFQEIYAQLKKFDATKTVRTFGALMVKPGGFVNGFLAGKRVKFVGPVRYLFYGIFIEITIRLLLAQFYPDAALHESDRSTLMSELSNLGLSVLWGLCWAVVFWKAEMNLVEYTVAAIYFAGHLSFVSAILTPVLFFASWSGVVVGSGIAHFDIAFSFIYSIFFARFVFGGSWRATIAKQLLVFAGFVAALTLLASFIRHF